MSETPYLETEILLAVIQQDLENAEALFETMTNFELREYLENLHSTYDIGHKIARKRKENTRQEPPGA